MCDFHDDPANAFRISAPSKELAASVSTAEKGI
jgi:hypothetical protein